MKKLHKNEKKLFFEDLGLSEQSVQELVLKSDLLDKASEAISISPLSQGEIANLLETSRTRINRIANKQELSVSIEFLLRITNLLLKKPVIKVLKGPVEPKSKKMLLKEVG